MAIKIMLDAGHFAKYNRSPIVPEYYESERMWVLQGFLKKALEGYGFKVSTTRSAQQTDLAVVQRGKAAKGYDMFISLHSNASSSEKTDRVVVYCAYDNQNESQTFGGVIAAAVAELMEASYGTIATRQGDNGEYYGVLRGARSVLCPLYYLIEHSFHTNEKATRWLLEDENLQRLAQLEAALIANFYGLTKVTGDVNGDGVLTASDYLLVKRAVLGTVTLTDEQSQAADVNNDGKIDAIDYTMIKRAVLGTYEL